MSTPVPPPIRVLVVDDSGFMRIALRKIVEADGDIRVVGEAKNGREAIRLARELKPDVVTMDIVMPEMDGIELARLAAELDPTLKIMFITGFAAVALNPDVPTPHEAKVLSKPFHLRDLVAEVDRLMAAA